MEELTNKSLMITPILSIYLLDDSSPRILQNLKKEGVSYRVVRVKVPGEICPRHHKPIIGYRGGYHDDGYCSKRDGCWSEEGEIVEKRLIVFAPNIQVPEKHNDLMNLCRDTVPNPEGFRWVNLEIIREDSKKLKDSFCLSQK